MLITLLQALAPIALLIALGAGFRRRAVLSDAFWPQAERLSYYVLLPALFIHGLASARLDGLPVWPMVAALVASTVAVALGLWAARPHLAVSRPAFTSVFQGGCALTIMSAYPPPPGCLARRAWRWRRWPMRRLCPR